MNPVIHFSFAEWLANQETIDEMVRYRAEMEQMSHVDQVKQLLNTGDLVDMSSERGRKMGVQSLGIIVNKSGNKVTVAPMSDPQQPIEIPMADLYFADPEQMDPATRVVLQRDIGKMQQARGEGSPHIKLWEKRTKRQRQHDVRRRDREEESRQQRAAAFQSTMPRTPEVSRSDIANIRSFLMGGDESKEEPQENDPLSALFSQGREPNKPKSPLRAFMGGNKGRSRGLDALLAGT